MPSRERTEHKNRIRAQAEALFREGRSYRVIAETIGMSRDTVHKWFRDRPEAIREVGGNSTAYARELEKHQTAQALRDRDDRMIQYAREYEDLGVRLLGDPPRHRSALAQKGQNHEAR